MDELLHKGREQLGVSCGHTALDFRECVGETLFCSGVPGKDVHGVSR